VITKINAAYLVCLVRTHARSVTAQLLVLALLTQSVLFLTAVTVTVTAQTRDTQAEDGKDRKAKKAKKKKKRGAKAEADTAIYTAPWVYAPNEQEKQATEVNSSPQNQNTDPSNTTLEGRSIQVASVSRINFKDLSKTKARPQTITGARDEQLAPAPMTIDDSSNAAPAKSDTVTPSGRDVIPGPSIPSPAPSQNFLGQEDSAKVGTGTFTIPPDTMGAVGLDKVFVTVNNNYRIQDKATGTALSTVSIDTFWSSTGASGSFDPRVQFDPYQQRWLLTVVSNAVTANSSVLVGVSDTADPQGSYTLFRIIVGCAPGAGGCNANGEWADFPMLGFNKNWIAVGWNQFTINTSAFVSGKMLVLDYPTLRTGTAVGTIFSNASAATGFCMHPATTFSNTEETLFVPTHQQSAGALYRLHSITGTPGSPVFTLDATARVRPGGGWTQPGGDNLPQQCIPGVSIPTQTCPVSPRGLEAADAFIRSNAVFRNGKIYYPQSIALPAGGLTVASRFVAQWTALNPDGTFFDGGRVEDATAQIFNGGQHYSYPSLAVNKNGDILFGFSEFESDDYVDAGYTFRLAGDPAGTMRDPIIYKEGEDYYQKTFSGTRNRWGDYSHTVVDPANDRDMWTIQEYSQPRVGATGQGSNDSRWSTWWARVNAPAGAGELIISEFRLRGPAGANDEFVEIYNASGTDFTVQTIDGSAGYAVAASDGVVRFTIPNGTVIPAKGHYLGANSVAYSLAGNATGDVTYTTDIPDNAGIALFNTATPANFSLATRLDAAGSTSEANTLYKEGAGYPALTPFSIDYSFFRSFCPGNTPVFGSALGCNVGSAGLPKDTNANENDFVFADTNGTSAGAGQRLAAPGPENLASPTENNAEFVVNLLDSSVGGPAPPNRVRDFTSDPPNNSTFGTLDIRRRYVNNTGAPVTRLRFRVVDINTFPAPSGFADLRTRTSSSVVVSGINDPATCSPNPAPCSVTVEGTTLEQPPSQPNGGAFNSTYSAGTITLGTPLAPGASVNLRFLLGIQQTGSFRFFLNLEALP
jgi:hypothetical protein